jgi:TM2 domain-containing membrane protein YozV
VIEGVECVGARNFSVNRPCIWTNGYRFEIAMALSALAGFLGFDRCYLGYIALGFVKFMTCGGFVVWALLDIALIATQTLKPADGSDYEFTSSIPRLMRLRPENHSFYR